MRFLDAPSVIGASVFRSHDAGAIALTVKAAPAPTVDIFTVRNSADFPLVSVKNNGTLGLNMGFDATGLGTAQVIGYITGLNGQTGDLLRFRDYTTATIAAVKADGSFLSNGYGHVFNLASGTDDGSGFLIKGFNGQIVRQLFDVQVNNGTSIFKVNQYGVDIWSGVYAFSNDYFAGATGAMAWIKGGNTAQGALRVSRDSTGTLTKAAIEVGKHDGSTFTQSASITTEGGFRGISGRFQLPDDATPVGDPTIFAKAYTGQFLRPLVDVDNEYGDELFTLLTTGASFFTNSLYIGWGAWASRGTVHAEGDTGTVSTFRAVRDPGSAANAHVADFGTVSAGEDTITSWITMEGDFAGKGMIAGRLDGAVGDMLANPAGDATSGATTQDSGTLTLRTKRWTGSASANEDVILQAKRRSAAAGDMYLSLNRDLSLGADFYVRNMVVGASSIFLGANTQLGNFSLTVGDIATDSQRQIDLERLRSTGAYRLRRYLYAGSGGVSGQANVLYKDGVELGRLQFGEAAISGGKNGFNVMGLGDIAIDSKSLGRGVQQSSWYAQITANSTAVTATTDVDGLAVTVTLLEGRRYRVSGVVNLRSTSANDRCGALIREGETTLYVSQVTVTAANTGFGCPLSVILTPSAGSHTYKIAIYRVAGSGNVSVMGAAIYPSYIMVEDIGAA